MDMQEIAKIVASNTARIDLPMWLRDHSSNAQRHSPELL